MGHYLQPLTLTTQQNRTLASHSIATRLPDSVWVKLATLPNPYSHDEALLLCRQSEDEWLAWIPDQGEIVLHVSEFYFDSAWN